MIQEFKTFLLRGNVLDLAVGVVIGGAFTNIVNQIVQGVLTPLIALIVSALTGKKDLNSSLSVLDWEPVKGVVFSFGAVVSAIITFVLVGFILFLVVKAANKASKKQPEEAGPTAEDYLKDIRDLLSEKNK